MMPTFRYLLLVCLFIHFTSKAQSQEYEIWGNQEILVSCDSQNIATYFIESQFNILSTDWRITPSGAFFYSQDNHSVVVGFYAPGVYFLVATSVTPNGETFSDTLEIYVTSLFLEPEIVGCYELSGDDTCYRVCAFSEMSIYFDYNFEFEFSGGEIVEWNYQEGYVDIVWGAGGYGELTTYGNGQCTNTLCFEILPLPVADFITDPPAAGETLSVCLGQEIFFSNESYNGLEYHWSFGDGSESTGFDASHQYDEPGFYTVILSASSICDCADEKEIVVEVLPLPSPSLDCINSVCEESRQRYTATTDGCTGYQWDVSANGTIVNGGGPADDFVEVIWHTGPAGQIQLTVSGCSTQYCNSTSVFTIPVISPDGPIAGDAQVCSGEISTYTVPYFPGVEYNWTVGPFGTIAGGQNTNGITVQWDDAGFVAPSFVEVTYDNCFLECGGNAHFDVTITPEIYLIGPSQVCAQGDATIMAEGGFVSPVPADVFWHIENTAGVTLYTHPTETSSFTHNFDYPPGEYYWVATNVSASYCSDIIRQKILVTGNPSSPVSIEGESEICPGITYGYTVSNNGHYLTDWTVTDGGNTYYYTGQTMTHVFGPSDPYIIEAVNKDIQYNQCQSAPATLILEKVDDIVIEGITEACLNSIDTFSSKLVSGAAYQWEIIPADHGEIRKSNQNKIEVFWTQTGPATIRLQLCGVMVEKNITVHDLPTFTISGPVSACENELVTISTSQPAWGHVWTDEDENVLGNTSMVSLPPGSFGVEVTDLFGCQNKSAFNITSWPAPVVHLSSAAKKSYCTTIPGGIEIVANTDGADYSYAWFRDDLPVAGSGPVYAVTDFGEYHVVVTNQYGCQAISEKISFINCCPPDICPGGGGGLPGGCTYGEGSFDIDRIDIECNSRQYVPMHPDILPGTTSWIISSLSKGVIGVIAADVLDYTYDLPGYYHITMLAELDGESYTPTFCSHKTEIIDTILAVAGFEHTGHCIMEAIQFEDLTTFLPGQSIASWAWDFGDPGSGADNLSGLQDPTHIYAAAGNYTVTLDVTLASGCITSFSGMINILDGPALMPDYDMIYCEDEGMTFLLPGQLFDISWDFGDPGSGVENNAVSDTAIHVFADPGVYNITVGASDIFGCPSTVNFDVDIRNNGLSGDISVLPANVLCYGDTAILSAPAGGVTWNWTNEASTENILVTQSDQYGVLITDLYGCTYAPPPQFIEFIAKPQVVISGRIIYGPEDFGTWSSSLDMCYGEEFELQVFGSGTDFIWHTGVITQSLVFTQEGGLPTAGSYTYYVVSFDPSTGCYSDTSFFDFVIHALPQAPVISLTSGTGCSHNDNVLAIANPEAGVTYTWSDGQTGVSIIATNGGAYSVTATSPSGCTQSGNAFIIKNSAQIDQLPGGCHIKCDPLTVCLPDLTGVSSFTIYHDGVPFLSGTNWPDDFLITSDGSYVFEVTGTNGCVAVSDPLDILLYPGIGDITVLTYEDTDGDGTISGADVLLGGIPVVIVSGDGSQQGSTWTEPNGSFVFKDYPLDTYTAYFDQSLLSSQWQIIIDSVSGTMVQCDDSIVVSLLLMENCTVLGPDLTFELCEGETITIGDSTWSSLGQYEMHMLSSNGCDSIFQVFLNGDDSLSINAFVWVDVDQNGIHSPADTLLANSAVILEDASFNLIDNFYSGTGGQYPVGNYFIRIDTGALSGFLPLYWMDTVSDTVCGGIIFDFLVIPSCQLIYILQSEIICAGDSIFFQNQWIDAAGVYSFVLQDPDTGCDTLLDLQVSFHPEVQLTYSTDWHCIDGGTIILETTGTGPFYYSWDPDDWDTDSVYGLAPGIYGVTVTDANQCMDSETITISPDPLLDFDLTPYHEIIPGDSVELILSGDVLIPGLNFQWIPSGLVQCESCATTWAYPFQDTTFTIFITDEDGCVYTLMTFVHIQEDTTQAGQVYVPNVFTPNHDGINDLFAFGSNDPGAEIEELIIFDRWGNMVYSTQEIMLTEFYGWDGTFREKPLHPQVFAFRVKFRMSDGRSLSQYGNVTLVR